MEREAYIKAMLEQYLLVTKNYTQPIKEEDHILGEEFAFNLTKIINFEHINNLSRQKSLNEDTNA